MLFDFGGVIAEEGFRRALVEAARRHGLDADTLLGQAMDAVYESGFVLGRGDEDDFWAALRAKASLPEEFSAFRDRVLQGFELRPSMLALVDELRQRGLTVAILSDQTHWLDELDRRDGIYRHFDRVFNSYYLGKGKRDPTLFRDVLSELGFAPEESLFVDDSAGHVERARAMGLEAVHCPDPSPCIEEVRRQVGIEVS
ncbi:MAG: HAD family hydrolase [Pseudomonadota bacterium]